VLETITGKRPTDAISFDVAELGRRCILGQIDDNLVKEIRNEEDDEVEVEHLNRRSIQNLDHLESKFVQIIEDRPEVTLVVRMVYTVGNYDYSASFFFLSSTSFFLFLMTGFPLPFCFCFFPVIFFFPPVFCFYL